MRKQDRNPNLARALKVLRTRANKSLKEISPFIGVSPQILSRWENAVAPIPDDRLPHYLEAVGFDISDLQRELGIGLDTFDSQNIPSPSKQADILSDLESFEVKDEAMSPWCEPGEKVWFRRGQHPRRYEGCVVEMKDGPVLIRRYERERDGFYFFQRINPEGTETVLHSLVKGIHRIAARGD